MQALFDFFGWTFAQRAAATGLDRIISQLFSFRLDMRQITASLVLIAELLSCMLFKTPITPYGEPLDLEGYELVFEDNFDTNELNTELWSHRAEGERRIGYNNRSQIRVHDGSLFINGEYLEDGAYGEGFYAAMLCTNELFCKGYFEISCKCNSGTDFWSAFWLQSRGINPYDHEQSNGGIYAAELDIMESSNANLILKSHKNSITSNIHCNGVDDSPELIDSLRLGSFKGNNIYEEFNTYGLKWTDTEYIFYVNGVESCRTSFGKGVCQNPLELIISLELPAAVSKRMTSDPNYKTFMEVDYVRIYQAE